MANKAASGGISTGTALCLIFITLKLCHVITWSWWWVLSPVWIPLTAGLAILVVALVWIVLRALLRKF